MNALNEVRSLYIQPGYDTMIHIRPLSHYRLLVLLCFMRDSRKLHTKHVLSISFIIYSAVNKNKNFVGQRFKN
jgi:hypothetical protein